MLFWVGIGDCCYYGGDLTSWCMLPIETGTHEWQWMDSIHWCHCAARFTAGSSLGWNRGFRYINYLCSWYFSYNHTSRHNWRFLLLSHWPGLVAVGHSCHARSCCYTPVKFYFLRVISWGIWKTSTVISKRITDGGPDQSIENGHPETSHSVRASIVKPPEACLTFGGVSANSDEWQPQWGLTNWFRYDLLSR